MEKEDKTIITNYDYELYFLYDLFELVKYNFTVVFMDKTLNRLYDEIIGYLDSKLKLSEGGDIEDIVVSVIQKSNS